METPLELPFRVCTFAAKARDAEMVCLEIAANHHLRVLVPYLIQLIPCSLSCRPQSSQKTTVPKVFEQK